MKLNEFLHEKSLEENPGSAAESEIRPPNVHAFWRHVRPPKACKELEVEIVPSGLRVIASEKKKEKPEVMNLLQVISNYFSGLHLKGEEMMAKRQSHLFELNRTLLGKLSRK